jgi:ethanolamine utilization protein EutS
MDTDKQRIIQEYVPGKQITLAHMIPNPNTSIYDKIGVAANRKDALGIMTITPSEAAIIGADLALKMASVEIVFVDRFSGSLVITGDVASVEAAVREIIRVLRDIMGFSATELTRS